MNKRLRSVLIINLLALPSFVTLQANKKEFARQACASGTSEDRNLMKQVLILFRDYCINEKELIQNDYIPEDEKQEITSKMQEKHDKINEIFMAQKDNTCFINKMIIGIKAFNLQLAQDKIKTIDALLEELNKK